MELEELIKSKIDALNIEDLIKQEIEEQVSEYVQKIINSGLRKIIEDQATGLAEKEVEKRLASILETPVEINDGWGLRKDYKNFDELFKQQLKSQLSSDYNLQKRLEGTIKDKLDVLLRGAKNELIEKLASQIVK